LLVLRGLRALLEALTGNDHIKPKPADEPPELRVP